MDEVSRIIIPTEGNLTNLYEKLDRIVEWSRGERDYHRRRAQQARSEREEEAPVAALKL